jgi:hypothetical protein
VWVLSAGGTPLDFADPRSTIVGDTGDPTAQAWLLAWNGHAVLHDAALWRTNAFHPESHALAFSDTLLGYAPAGMVGDGPVAAVTRYNIVFVLTFALAFLGGYALLRQLGAGRVAAAVAGAAFAYAPWRYGHDGHLNILSTGGIALALAMLARGHGWSLAHGYRPEATRPWWALTGWAVAAWQVSLGFGVGLPFGYVLASGCVAAAAGWLLAGRPAMSRRLLLCDLGGGALFAVVCLWMARAYLRVREQYPDTVRSWDYVAVFSPTPRSFLVAPDSSLLWGAWHEGARTALSTAANEKALLGGLVLYALAVGGLFVSIWTPRQRLLLAAGVVLGALFALGTNGPVYELLYRYVPGFDGSRTPGRLVLWPMLLLIVLAAGLVSALAAKLRTVAVRPYAGRLALAGTVPLLVAVLAEGAPNLEHPDAPVAPAAFTAAEGPLIVLPSDEGIDLNVMLWSTDGFPTMVNGGSSFNPPEHQRIRDVMQTFPSPESIELLRRLGIRNVVVLRNLVAGTPFAATVDAPVDGVTVTRRDVGPDVVYTIVG